MITGQCLSENTEINKCIEYCPEEGCIQEGALRVGASVLMVVSALIFSLI